MRRRRRLLKNQRGQLLIEALLIISMLLIFFKIVHDTVLGEEFASTFIAGPFQRLSGVIESGVYGEPQEARGQHPNHQFRMLSFDPNG